MQYLIGDLLFRMDGRYLIPGGNFMEQFLHRGDWNGESVTLEAATEPLTPWLTQRLRGDNGVYEIHRHDGQTVLSYHWGNQYHGFLIHPERFAVTFPPEMAHQPPIPADWFFSVSGFHRVLLHRKACVLHASYIDAGGKAILFTAPSGTGKSTQAALWEQFAGAQTINGDRAVLRRREGVWHAFGYPCCGSSQISRNRTLPLGAVVVLAQSPENAVDILPAGQKIRALAAAMEFYHWDRSEMNMVFDLAMELAAAVPVVRLRCRPDEEAVHVLKHYLTGEGILDGI